MSEKLYCPICDGEVVGENPIYSELGSNLCLSHSGRDYIPMINNLIAQVREITDLLQFEFEKVDDLTNAAKKQRLRAEKAEDKLELAKEAIKKAERLLDNNFGFRNQETIDAWNILVGIKQQLEE